MEISEKPQAEKKLAYTFATIRYRHDAVSGEMLNIGLVMSGKDGRFRFRLTQNVARLKAAWPDFEERIYHSMRESLETALDAARLKGEAQNELPDALACAHMSVPPCEGPIKWSNLMCGVGHDLHARFDQNFARFVTKYDTAD